MTKYRILITGSRTWTDLDAIRQAFQVEYDIARRDGIPGHDIILVSGTCRGADLMCEQVWSRQGLPVERHPANWKHPDGTKNTQGGFIRNQLMVDLGADVCLAFIRAESNGASHTARRAERAGIPTKRFTQD